MEKFYPIHFIDLFNKQCKLEPMNFNTLLGKTLVSVEMDKGKTEMVFTCDNGEKFILFHSQDCCESVRIEDICGDLNDLINSPILQAEESTNQDNPPANCESFTWTFYRITTMKGQVVLRWLGESNGFYSESVDFAKIK